MKWSSQPGASAGTNASSTATPARDRRLKAGELARGRGGALRVNRAADDDPLRGAPDRPFARHAGHRADPVHIGIEDADHVALARRLAHCAYLARLQWPGGKPGHLLVERLAADRRPVFAIADAVDADVDLSLHDLGNHRHDPRLDLRVADLAGRKQGGDVLETRRRREPPDMAAVDPVRAVVLACL